MRLLLGCDFSSSPSRHKPIVVALGDVQDDCVRLCGLLRFDTLDSWGDWLAGTPALDRGFRLSVRVAAGVDRGSAGRSNGRR